MNPVDDADSEPLLTVAQARAVVHHYARRAAPARVGEPPVALPTLGAYLRALREAIVDPRTGRPISRERAAHRIGLSLYYLRQIETDTRIPTAQALHLLAEGYELTGDQIEHIHRLRAPARPLPSPGQCATRLCAGEGVGERLADLDHAGVVAAYFDPLWNLLAANTGFRQLFPGMDDHANWVDWHFTAPARERLETWEQEAALMVALLKPGLARHRESAPARHLLERLRSRDGFAALWHTTTIAFSRHQAAPTRVHDSERTWVLNAEVAAVEHFPIRTHLYLVSPRLLPAGRENTGEPTQDGDANCITPISGGPGRGAL